MEYNSNKNYIIIIIYNIRQGCISQPTTTIRTFPCSLFIFYNNFSVYGHAVIQRSQCTFSLLKNPSTSFHQFPILILPIHLYCIANPILVQIDKSRSIKKYRGYIPLLIALRLILFSQQISISLGEAKGAGLL